MLNNVQVLFYTRYILYVYVSYLFNLIKLQIINL